MKWVLHLLLLCVPLVRGREVAITIDDLPRGGDRTATFEETRQMTRKLLEPFRAGRIPLTAFVNECRHPDRLRELLSMWIDAGAELGNHTCSHLDLNITPVAEYEADIIKGESVTAALVGRRPRYFRHPMLRTGKDQADKGAINEFLHSRGYTIAPVTLDNSDYMFALAYAQALDRGDNALAQRVKDAYLPYMESIFEFFEKRSVEVTGHEIRQVLLIHASQLNADVMPAMLALIKRRGYTVVPLARALEDKAYALPEMYAGPGGFSWIHRWSKTKGMAPKGEVDEPSWITDLWNKR